jgi:oxygen-dependent protoporphyrinogen oxidase
VRLAVVGGGIAGLAAAYEATRAGAEVVVLDAGDRPGGKVRSVPFAGTHFEPAPDAFLARRPEAVDLCRELGLEDELVAPTAGSSYVWARGALRRLPTGLVLGVPTDFRTLRASGVLTTRGAMRAAIEPWLPGSPLAGDEAVGRLIARRYGREVAERLVDSLVGGINAARTDDLSIDVAAPQLAAAARRDRSLTRALRTTPAPPASAAPVFLTLRNGIGGLTAALVEAIESAGGVVRTGSTVEGLRRAGARYEVGGELADGVVLAAPAFATAPLLAPHAPTAAAALGGIGYASVSVVALAVPREAVPHPLDGSGFLVPRPEGLLMTACTWLTSKWGHLDAGDSVLLKVSAGRMGDDRHLALSDEQLVAQLRRDLTTTMGLRAEPTEIAVHRWPASFPQYAPGHLARMASATGELIERLPGVGLAGAYLAGVGLPACIGSGRAAARRALGQERTQPAG